MTWTAWDEKWTTPEARAYQRRLLADEIAQAAVIAAREAPDAVVYGPGAQWAWMNREQWDRAVNYARACLNGAILLEYDPLGEARTRS